MKKEMVEEIGNDIKEKKKMSKDYEAKVNKRIFSNVLLAILVLAYLVLLILGFKNIEENILIVDLKVFSVGILCVAVVLFEKSYKKEDGKLCLYGVEMLLLAIMTLGGIYVLKIVPHLFVMMVSALAVLVAFYYIIKSIGIYGRSKKKYVKDQNDIKDIIKPEEPEKIETKKKKYAEENISYTDPIETLNTIETKEKEIVPKEAKAKKEEKIKKAKKNVVKGKEKKNLAEIEKENAPEKEKIEIKEENVVENSMNEKLEMLERRIKANSQRMNETTNKVNRTKTKEANLEPTEKKVVQKPEKKTEEKKEVKVEKTKKSESPKKTEAKKTANKANKTSKTTKIATKKQTVTENKKVELTEKKISEKVQKEDTNGPKTIPMSPFDMEIAGITPEDLNK